MTNPDTSTLNGALEQLGITMADNLVTMGVSDADPSDGLTTLAGKILEIAPVPPTPTPASLDLSLTAGKQILSYADVSSGTEYATFTATVLDQNDDPLPGVSVSIYKDNVLWYTAETGAGGTISKTYDSEGVGDVSFHAVCGSLVTESFVVRDAIYYNPDSITSSTELNIPNFPTNFVATFTVHRTTSTQTNQSWLEVGSNSSNCIFGGLDGRAGGLGVYVKVNGSYERYQQTDGVIPMNTDALIEFKYDNGVITVKYGNTTKSVSSSTITTRTYVKANVITNIMKELLIMPL